MILERDFLKPHNLSIEIRDVSGPTTDHKVIELRGEIVDQSGRPVRATDKDLPTLFVQRVSLSDTYVLKENHEINFVIEKLLFDLDRQVDRVWGEGAKLKKELKKLL
jgi:hypothetical protein